MDQVLQRVAKLEAKNADIDRAHAAILARLDKLDAQQAPNAAVAAETKDIRLQLDALRSPFHDPAGPRLLAVPELMENILLQMLMLYRVKTPKTPKTPKTEENDEDDEGWLPKKDEEEDPEEDEEEYHPYLETDEYGSNNPAELREMDGVRHLLVAQRTCKQFKAVIDGSPKLQRALFFQDDPDREKPRSLKRLIEDRGLLKNLLFIVDREQTTLKCIDVNDLSKVPLPFELGQLSSPRIEFEDSAIRGEARKISAVTLRVDVQKILTLDSPLAQHSKGGAKRLRTAPRSALNWLTSLDAPAVGSWRRMYVTQPALPIKWEGYGSGKKGMKGMASKRGTLADVVGKGGMYTFGEEDQST